jgi:lipopolysaccharide export system permease protein
LTEATARTFEGDTSQLTRMPSLTLDLEVRQNALRSRPGRPEQRRMHELRQQIRARRAVGLPIEAFSLAMHNRFAYPFAGVPAAILAVGLALRAGRKGHLTTAVVEGLLVAAGLWGIMVVSKALVLGGRVPAGPAAWAPVIGLGACAAAVWIRQEGLWQPRPR